MAPLSLAVKVTLAESLDDGTKMYNGFMDPDWLVGSVGFGGGLLAAMLNAVSQFQASTRHPDPINLSSHFLRAVVTGPFTVHVRPTRNGRLVDLLDALLYQNGALMITCRFLYGDFSQPGRGLTMPEVYRPLCPIATHPSDSDPSRGMKIHVAPRFQHLYKRADDVSILDANNRTPDGGPGLEGLQHGCWIELGEDAVGPIVIPVIGDIGEFPDRLMRKDVMPENMWWYPSLTMNIDFRRRLPLTDGAYASHTFGLYARKRHLDKGRWIDYFEIWSAPGDIGAPRREGDSGESWRETMVCLATGMQTAMVVSPETNSRYSKVQSKL